MSAKAAITLEKLLSNGISEEKIEAMKSMDESESLKEMSPYSSKKSSRKTMLGKKKSELYLLIGIIAVAFLIGIILYLVAGNASDPDNKRRESVAGMFFIMFGIQVIIVLYYRHELRFV